MGCNFLSVTDLLTGADVDCPLWHCVDLERWSSKVMIAELRPNQSIKNLVNCRCRCCCCWHHWGYFILNMIIIIIIIIIIPLIHSFTPSINHSAFTSHHHVINSRTQNKENLKKKKTRSTKFRTKIYSIENIIQRYPHCTHTHTYSHVHTHMHTLTCTHDTLFPLCSLRFPK